MNKFLFSTMSLSVTDGVEEPFDLEYYIIENISMELNKGQKKGATNTGTYGIEVVKLKEVKVLNTPRLKQSMRFAAEEEIDKIAKLVSDYTVTPITLEDVITDLVANSFRERNIPHKPEIPSA